MKPDPDPVDATPDGLEALARRLLRALLDDPLDAAAWVDLATIRIEQGRYGEAISYARRARSLEPERRAHQYTLAIALQASGDTDAAAPLLDELVEGTSAARFHAEAPALAAYAGDSLRNLPDRSVGHLAALKPPTAPRQSRVGAVGADEPPQASEAPELTRATGAPTINVILSTIRFDDTFRSIVRAALRACKEGTGVHLTIADGALDPAKIAWIDSAIAAAGVDVVVIRKEDFGLRLQAALDPAFEWTLFLSDDDPFTVNYFSSFASKARVVDGRTSAILPSMYIGHGCDQVLVTRTVPVVGVALAARLASFHSDPRLACVSFYSLIRTDVVSAWNQYLQRKGYAPSYADQLLVTLAAARGTLDLVDDFSVLVREESTWIDQQQAIRADARCYPSAEMVLYHELFWIGDVVDLLSGCDGFDETGPVLRPWAMLMLTMLSEKAESRAASVGANASVQRTQILQACQDALDWLKQTEDPVFLLVGLRHIARFASDVHLNSLAHKSGAAARSGVAVGTGHRPVPVEVKQP